MHNINFSNATLNLIFSSTVPYNNDLAIRFNCTFISNSTEQFYFRFLCQKKFIIILLLIIISITISMV